MKRIVPPCIDMARIRKLIADTPFITDLQKRFYCTMLEKRKERILDYSLERLKNAPDKKASGQSRIGAHDNRIIE